MSYFILLLGITTVAFFIGTAYIVSMGNMIRKLNQQSPIIDIANRWKIVSILVMTFTVIYFLLRIFQYNSGLHDTVHIIFDFSIFLLLLSTAIISRKNVSLIKYWGMNKNGT